MNFNICKQCKYKTNKYFLDLISEKQYKFLGVYKHDTDYYCQLTTEFKHLNLTSTMTFNLIKKIFKNKIKPDKSCPYYVQHQLTEWSKKMKIRSNYVSNSSSSSFVVKLIEDDKIMLNDNLRIILENENFRYVIGYSTNVLHYSFQNEEIMEIDKKKFNINDKTHHHICMVKEILCNQEEVMEILFKYHIPFIAEVDNGRRIIKYDGKEYYEELDNYIDNFLNGELLPPFKDAYKKIDIN